MSDGKNLMEDEVAEYGRPNRNMAILRQMLGTRLLTSPLRGL